MMTEVPDDSDSEDARSVEIPDPRKSTILHTPVLRYPEQLSVIEEGYSESDERFSQQVRRMLMIIQPNLSMMLPCMMPHDQHPL